MAWLWACLAAPICRAAAPVEYAAEVSIGGEYDSNVTLDEVDLTSSESDYALLLEAGFAAKKAFTEQFEMSGTYDLSQTFYKEFDQVNRQTHILGTDMNLDHSRYDTGMSVYYIISRLDNERFLDLLRVSPSVSGFLAKKWFARGAYVYFNKSIHKRPERDAHTQSGEADLYYFLRGLRSYVNLGYRYRDEDAAGAQYSFSSNAVKLRYIGRFELFSRIAKLELAWRYEDRDYSAETPSIGEDRDDQRNRWRIDFELPLVGQSSMQVFAGYADYDSNYPQADYTQTVVGTRFTYRW
ncbi:MAG: DUF560 domain-containing protein [Halioglobus sp.]|nr:DUF560 domain-containing protein [Halioglobus sp.]